MTKTELENVYGGISFSGALINVITRGIYIVYNVSKVLISAIRR